jgi:hypothetical protein
VLHTRKSFGIALLARMHMYTSIVSRNGVDE